jgi:hypothetical protein
MPRAFAISAICRLTFFHHKPSVCTITDFQHAVRDNEDLIGAARPVPVSQDGH